MPDVLISGGQQCTLIVSIMASVQKPILGRVVTTSMALLMVSLPLSDYTNAHSISGPKGIVPQADNRSLIKQFSQKLPSSPCGMRNILHDQRLAPTIPVGAGNQVDAIHTAHTASFCRELLHNLWAEDALVRWTRHVWSSRAYEVIVERRVSAIPACPSSFLSPSLLIEYSHQSNVVSISSLCPFQMRR